MGEPGKRGSAGAAGPQGTGQEESWWDEEGNLEEFVELPPDPRLSWFSFLSKWALIEADLHEVFGIDLGDPEMQARPWRWLRVRISQLLDSTPTFTPDGRRIMSTRLGRALYPTPPPKRS